MEYDAGNGFGRCETTQPVGHWGSEWNGRGHVRSIATDPV